MTNTKINDDKNSKDSEYAKQIEELNNKYLRALADYQNLEKQTDEWKKEFVQFANTTLIVKLLEVLDDLEKAYENLNDKGLELVITKFKKVLESEGVEKLELENQEYDPRLAEVISTEPGEKDNIITKVLQKGYRLKDKVIRPAKVIVSKISD